MSSTRPSSGRSVYWIALSGLAAGSAATPRGLLGYSLARRRRRADAAAPPAARAAQTEQLAKLSARADRRRSGAAAAIAIAGGRSVFAVNCAPCHGAGGQGGQGYPEPRRRRLALGRQARTISNTPSATASAAPMPTRASRRCRPSASTSADRAADRRRRRTTCCRSRAKPTDKAAAARGTADLRRAMRRLPRRGRQGQHGARRAQPDRRDLALRRQRRGDRGADHQSAATASCRPGRAASTTPTIKMLAVYVHSLGGGQ